MKVLYIAGWGRSGTTILDNVLSAYDSVFSVGELFYLWPRGFIERRRCGCGVTLVECPLWADILACAYRDSPPDARRTYDLQRRSIRVRDTRRLAYGRLDADAIRYRDEIARLYHAIAEVTGANVIVDSSKTPAGAAVLARIDGIEPYLLHVVRDPRATAYSWSRRVLQPDLLVPRDMPRHSAAASTATWVGWNMLVEDLARNGYGDRSRRLRYEDFAADPRGTVADLLEVLGVPPAGSPFTDRRELQLTANHTVGGNPGRFRTGSITIAPDDAWRAEQARRRRLVSTVIAAPLLRRYRYPFSSRLRVSGALRPVATEAAGFTRGRAGED
jgi:hypothetical protein